MFLQEVVTRLRIELQDRSITYFTDDELYNAVDKTVALMSRLIPQYVIKELQVSSSATDEEHVANASGEITVNTAPVKPTSDSLTKAGVALVRDTDYTINYMTGVISGLTDGDTYKATYSPDSYMLDISSIGEPIRLDQVEYPIGNSPASHPSYRKFGKYLRLAEKDTVLTATKKLRVYYLAPYDAPTLALEGTYPNHLDTAVIIGSSGEAMLGREISVLNDATTRISTIDTLLATLTSITFTPPTITTPTYTLSMPSVPSAPSLTYPSTPGVPTLTYPTPPSAPSLTNLSAPTSPTLTFPTLPTFGGSSPSFPVAVTLPTLGASAPSFIETPPTFPAGVALPTAPSLSFTAMETALSAVAGEITTAKGYLSTGVSLINQVNAGEDVGAVYGQYGSIYGAATARVNEAVGRAEKIKAELTLFADETNNYRVAVEKYNGDLRKFGLQLDEYGHDISEYRAEVDAFSAELNRYGTAVAKYNADISEYNAEVNKYVVDARNYADQLGEQIIEVNKYAAEVTSYKEQVGEEQLNLNKFAYEISSYKEQISKEQVRLNAYVAEVASYKEQMIEEQLRLTQYGTEVGAYAQEVNGKAIEVVKYQRDLDKYGTQLNEYVAKLNYFKSRIENVLNEAGSRFQGVIQSFELADRIKSRGLSLLNEFFRLIGYRAEVETKVPYQTKATV